ncbi:MAG: hypothetical protein IJ223_04825 [Clostridia bacterium]|nr:hypothetical protein [Clostridia bacterium]
MLKPIVNLYSMQNEQIEKFLSLYYEHEMNINNKLEWQKIYENPIEIASIIGVYIDNIDKFSINMWISLDDGIFINVTESNADKIIRYLYERYPY